MGDQDAIGGGCSAEQEGRTLIALVRHARTIWNDRRRVQGQADSPLTPEGRRQACAWGKALAGTGFGLILASDLGRARATAEILAGELGLEVVIEPGLREMDWGRWTGRHKDKLRRRSPDRERERLDWWDFRPPDGESRREVLARATAALLSQARERPGARLLAVSHRGLIRSLVFDGLGFVPPRSSALEIEDNTLHWFAAGNPRLCLLRHNLAIESREVRPAGRGAAIGQE